MAAGGLQKSKKEMRVVTKERFLEEAIISLSSIIGKMEAVAVHNRLDLDDDIRRLVAGVTAMKTEAERILDITGIEPELPR
jgi:hypothetical protein